MNDRQKALLEKLNLNKADFEPKDTTVTDTERINDLEIAVCELLEVLESLE